ncbi:MAG: PAS domain-containing protein [Treponema sp.]|nr:PAS domain-containing protein [Treponema sp.]
MSEDMPDWVSGFSCAVMVTAKDGTILYMNDKSAKTYANSGGRELIGKNIEDCHNGNSKSIIHRLVEAEGTHAYTIEKKGVKKLIYQAPWYEAGELAGLVELSIEIPFEMPHFKRS